MTERGILPHTWGKMLRGASYPRDKGILLYIHVHISISMTNKSGLTFFLSIKYLSVCLSFILELSEFSELGG